MLLEMLWVHSFPFIQVLFVFFKNVKMQILTYAGTNVSLVMYKLHINLYLAKMRPVTSQKEEK